MILRRPSAAACRPKSARRVRVGGERRVSLARHRDVGTQHLKMKLIHPPNPRLRVPPRTRTAHWSATSARRPSFLFGYVFGLMVTADPLHPGSQALSKNYNRHSFAKEKFWCERWRNIYLFPSRARGTSLSEKAHQVPVLAPAPCTCPVRRRNAKGRQR